MVGTHIILNPEKESRNVPYPYLRFFLSFGQSPPNTCIDQYSSEDLRGPLCSPLEFSSCKALSSPNFSHVGLPGLQLYLHFWIISTEKYIVEIILLFQNHNATEVDLWLALVLIIFSRSTKLAFILDQTLNAHLLYTRNIKYFNILRF